MFLREIPCLIILTRSCLYVGHIFNLAGCKSLHTPSWQEVLTIGKGVVHEDKSEGSHQQKRCNDAQKLDTGLHSGWQAGNELRNKTIRRTEFVTVRSSQFKIETMEQVCSPENLRRAYKQVKQNK